MKVALMKDEVRLTPATWNRNRFQVGPIQSDGIWSEQVQAYGLVIDLRLIEWVDFGAVAQVVLFVHNASCCGINVDILLPDKRDHVRMGNGNLDEQAPARAARRIRAYGFLTYLQFPAVLLQEPELTGWIGPRVLDGDSPYVETKAGHNQASTYSTVVPLSWIDHNKPASLEQFTKFLSAVVSKDDLGLSSEDAQTLSNVIIFELVENVFTHAGGSKLALVAAWLRRAEQNVNAENYFEEEQEFLSASQSASSIVEIFVGDAGEGIVSTLESAFLSNAVTHNIKKKKNKANPHEVIHWAFDRWSSRKEHIVIEDRGVRGLYRVARIASRYRGLISVQSHLHFHTRDYREHGNLKISNQTHPYSFAHGTLLRLRLQVSRSTLSQTIVKQVQPWSKTSVPFNNNSLLISLGLIGANGIDDYYKNVFIECIKQRSGNFSGVIYVVFHGNEYHKHGLEAALKFLSQNSAPNAVAVFGLHAHDEELRIAVHSVNETCIKLKKQHPNDYKQQDPLLVFSNTGVPMWVGVTPHQRAAYETIMQTPGISLVDLIGKLNSNDNCSDNDLNELHRLLYEHPAIAQANVTSAIGARESSMWEPIEQLTIPMNTAEFLHLAAHAISDPLQTDNKKLTGVTKQIFLTPSLKVVNTWIDLPSYLEENELAISGYSAMVTLALKIRQSYEFKGEIHALLSDTSATPKLRDYFGSFLGLGSEQIIDAEEQPIDVGAPRTQGMGKRVIVYADLIASSETAKRTVVHALRQGYEVIAIACVLDTRIKQGEPLEVWRINIPVIAIANHRTELEDSAQYYVVKSPLGEDELPPTAQQTNRSDIHQLIARTGIVSLGHAIRPSGRHLTFTIKPKVLLEDALVLEKLRFEAIEWLSVLDSSSKSSVEVWTPVERENADIWTGLVSDVFRPAVGNREFSVTRFRKLDSYETTHFKRIGYGATARDKHIVVFDWGAITGASITQLSRRAVDEGALSVLAIVILSQMDAEDAAFLSRVSELTTFVPGKQLDLVTLSNPEKKKSVVKIHWLEKFTMGHYAAAHCPICTQRREFEEAHPHTEYLRQFRDAEIERMKPRTMRDVSESSSAYSYVDNAYFDAIQISDFREQLHDAYFSTIARLKISKEISRINEDIALATPTRTALTSAC